MIPSSISTCVLFARRSAKPERWCSFRDRGPVSGHHEGASVLREDVAGNAAVRFDADQFDVGGASQPEAEIHPGTRIDDVRQEDSR